MASTYTGNTGNSTIITSNGIGTLIAIYSSMKTIRVKRIRVESYNKLVALGYTVIIVGE